MSQTAITLAFEHWKAQQGATGEPVLLDEFVFANVPGLNPDPGLHLVPVTGWFPVCGQCGKSDVCRSPCRYPGRVQPGSCWR